MPASSWTLPLSALLLLLLLLSLTPKPTAAQLTVLSAPSHSIDISNSHAPSNLSLSATIPCAALLSASSFLWYTLPPSASAQSLTFDTCTATYDTVLAVLSGSSPSALSVLGCNDNRASGTPPCAASSSLLANVWVPAGARVWIVVGGYELNATVAQGSGALLLSAASLPVLQTCTAPMLNLAADSIASALSAASSQLTGLSGTHSAELSAALDRTSNASVALIAAPPVAMALQSASNSEVAQQRTLNASALAFADALSSVNASAAALSHLLSSTAPLTHSQLLALPAALSSLNATALPLVGAMATRLSSLNNSTALPLTLSGNLLANQTLLLAQSSALNTTLTSSLPGALTPALQSAQSHSTLMRLAAAQLRANSSALLSALQPLQSGFTAMLHFASAAPLQSALLLLNASQSSASASLLGAETLSTNLTALRAQIQSLNDSATAAPAPQSFATLLSALRASAAAVLSANATAAALFAPPALALPALLSAHSSLALSCARCASALSALTANVSALSADVLFADTLGRSLANPSAVVPMPLRMPNQYGGRMDDAMRYVQAVYATLSSAADAIGAAQSAACSGSAFCAFFRSAQSPYATAVAKFATYERLSRFGLAYSALQSAYAALFPVAW